MSQEARARPAWELADLALAAMAAALGAGGLLWAGAWAAATARSLPAPAFDPTRATQLLTHPADPSAAWGTPMPGPALYWTTTGLLLLLAGAGVVGLWWAW